MKLFNKKKLSSLISHFSFQKGFTRYHTAPGFTLIELLIVIAILGILAAGILTAINPVKKINQAKDATAKSDVGQVANAAQAYYTANSAVYPADAATFTSSNELKTFPATVTYVVNTGGSAAAAYAALQETTGKFICWDSTSSTIKTTTTTAPTAGTPTCN